MKSEKITILLSMTLGFLVPGAALADETTKTGGVGALVGTTQGQTEGAFVIQSAGESTQEDSTYGHGELRLEVGSGFGITGSGHGGASVTGLTEGDSAALLIGLEPLNLELSANTNAEREDFIEWQPMGAAGLQLALDSCRALLLARGGASLGTLGSGGARGAYGVGGYLNCPSVNVVGELTRIEDKHPIDIAKARVAVNLPDGRASLALQGEAINTRNEPSPIIDLLSGGDGSKTEVRGLVTVGRAF